jgi:hypothetical protein
MAIKLEAVMAVINPAPLGSRDSQGRMPLQRVLDFSQPPQLGDMKLHQLLRGDRWDLMAGRQRPKAGKRRLLGDEVTGQLQGELSR